ncbi:sugar ABC transporter permease [Paenibacillus alkaliterrae]|uniref:carbohydrate ABC transporter permease n=1 Tax=Paenibacillus alkaliterrae TaxID=320909 RepID=UPI001F1A8C01|nr:sugar ABC transporter permease [Paenibacillus alkaliterrae]MCF2941337.1 sugar ABC transporter permease [Paenibacillus alkaliterrae]
MNMKRLKLLFELETDSAYRLLVAPIVIFLLAVTVFPTLFALYTSTQHYFLSEPYNKHFTGLGNYAYMLQDSRFWGSLKTTFIFMASSIVIEMIMGIALALLMTRKFFGSGLAKTLFLLPTITTPVVVGLIWVMLYDPQFGFINYVLGELGFAPQAWLSGEKSAIWAVVAVDVWEWTPFVALVVLAGLQSLPDEPYEAATVDGANTVQKFFHLTLPLITPYLLIAFVFRFMDLFRWFDTIYVMTKGGPGTATETLNMFGYLTGFNFMNVGYAASIGLTMLFMITAISKFVIYLANKKG